MTVFIQDGEPFYFFSLEAEEASSWTEVFLVSSSNCKSDISIEGFIVSSFARLGMIERFF